MRFDETPDLLNAQARPTTDRTALEELLGMAFLGQELGDGMGHLLAEAPQQSDWQPDCFAEDLFVADLVRETLRVTTDGREHPVHQGFLTQVLSHPPVDLETVHFRQAILRELDTNSDLLDKTRDLYSLLARLLIMLKVPGMVAKLDINTHRLDILGTAKLIIDHMAENFGDATSGLRRLHETSKRIQASDEYDILSSLLDYESHFMALDIQVDLGADGRVRGVDLRKVKENTKNRLYRPPGKRLFDRLKLFVWNGISVSNKEMMNGILLRVYDKVSPSILALIEVVAHLEVYLGALELRDRVRQRGLEMCLAEIEEGAEVELDDAFNPLLLSQTTPVPTSVRRSSTTGATLITGPNSGGKTRLLQTVGLCQLLGQSGLFVPASRARLPLLRGMFVSLIESEAFDHAEGRLGREMVRIRKLFESMRPPAMVILDELCSGTNPSEGTELFSMVLELLDRVGAVGFVSTHFLDYAKGLRDAPPLDGLEFLQVEIAEDQRSTYQFLNGVAETSLAAVTAERLGVTFEKLVALLDERG